MRPFIPAVIMLGLIFGLRANVYPCKPPPSPGNATNVANLSICAGQNTTLSATGVGSIGWYSEPDGGTYLGNDINFTTPILSKTTTFYVQDSTCDASIIRTAITVIVNPKAIADFSVNDICENDSATFINKSQNAQTYKWKFNDGHISNLKSPKHFYNPWTEDPKATLVALDSNGCSDSILKAVNINSLPNSDFTFTANQNEVSFKPKHTENTYYKWFFGNGDSSLDVNSTYKYIKSGPYTVCLKVINAAGCFSETCKEVSVVAGVYPIKPNGLHLYPNPNSGSFTIERSETFGIMTVEVVNQIGLIVYREELKGNLIPMNLNLPNGIYLIRVTDGENIMNQKIIVGK